MTLPWKNKTVVIVFLVISMGAISAGAGETVTTNAPVAPSEGSSKEKAIGSTNETAAAETRVKTESTNVEAALAAIHTPAAPGLGQFPTPAILTVTNTAKTETLQNFQTLLDMGKEQRRSKNTAEANKTLAGLMQSLAPAEIQRQALFELALAAQDDGQLVKAQQIFAQYIHAYGEDPSVPEVLLRQGLIYRQMGISVLAVSKFYAVMSSALKLKLDNMDYYKNLVIQAQMEIADTFYMEGKYEEASDFYARLAKGAAPQLDQAQVLYKLVRSLSFLTNHVETVAKAQTYLEVHTNSSDVPEVRFLLASALKQLGRNHESMKQVLLLLQSQQENVSKNPETWVYWQQRAGNDIANQLYKEGDFLNALQIYLSLAELNKSAEWQLPVWYQTGLVYEQLKQWEKATQIYGRIQQRQKELTPETSNSSLVSLCDMAKWRSDYIAWMQKAQIANESLQAMPTNAISASAAMKK